MHHHNGPVTVVAPAHQPPHHRAATAGAWIATALALLAALPVAGALTAWLPASGNRTPLWLESITLGSAALLALACWLVRPRRSGVPIALAITAAGIVVPNAGGWQGLPPPLVAALLAAAPLIVVGIALVPATWRSSRPHRAVLALAGTAVAVHMIGYNPLEDPACTRFCGDVPTVLEGLVSTRAAVALAAVLSTIAAALALLTAVRSPRAPVPVTGAALAGTVALATAAITRLAAWGQTTPTWYLLIAPPAAAGILAAVVITVEVQARRRRVATARIVRGLAQPTGNSTITGIVFAVPAQDRWVDADGAPAELAPAGRHLVLSDRTGPVVRLGVADHAADEDVNAALTPAVQLALRNAALIAVDRAHVADVRASQRRIVALADAERRRIERDLHDGAQQRLVAASLHLAHLRNHTDTDSAATTRLDTAQQRVHHALATLRRLTHGSLPTALADEGLTAALDELVRDSPGPTSLDVGPPPLPPISFDAATTVYLAVAASLAASRAPVSVAVGCRNDLLHATVEITAGRPDDQTLTDLADRIGAAGGNMQVISNDSATVIRLEVPCGS